MTIHQDLLQQPGVNPSFMCRDDMMRGNLEAHLMYSSPSELLVVQPVTAASRRLLGSFTQAVHGLKAEAVSRAKYQRDEARQAILDFYAAGESDPLLLPMTCT